MEQTSFGFMPYAAAWRKRRRLFWHHFHPSTISKYRPLQRTFAHVLLRKIHENPRDLLKHIETLLL